MPVIKPIISGASVKNATIVPITAEEDLLIGDPVALYYKPGNMLYEVPYDSIGAGEYSHCTFSPDNSLLALYVYKAGAVWPTIYDVNSGEVLPAPDTVLGSKDYVANCVFSPDGRQFVVSSVNESAAYVYDATTRPFTLQAKLSCTRNAKLIYNHAGTRLCVYEASTGTLATSAYWGIYDMENFSKLTNPAGFTGSAINIRAVSYSPDDAQMAIVYEATVDSSDKWLVGIFDNRGLTPTQVAYYDNYSTSILDQLRYNPDGTQIYGYYNGWHIFDVTPTSISKPSRVLTGEFNAGAYLCFCPTEQALVGLLFSDDINNDSVEDVAIASTSLSGNYIHQYDLKLLASEEDTDPVSISISPDGTHLFVNYRANEADATYAFFMQVYKMEWFAKKANYRTQQFAQAVGYAMNNIKIGQTGKATRII